MAALTQKEKGEILVSILLLMAFPAIIGIVLAVERRK